MALSKEELSNIKDGVNRAKKKTMAFAFSKKRKDGSKDPLLLIDKTESMVKKAIRNDGQPPLMWGSIQMMDKTLAFVVDKGKPKDIQQAMLKGLKKAHTLLNKAQVISREEFDAVPSEPKAEPQSQDSGSTRAQSPAAASEAAVPQEIEGAKSTAKNSLVEKRAATLTSALQTFQKEQKRLEDAIKKATGDDLEDLYDQLDDLIEDFQAQADSLAKAMA